MIRVFKWLAVLGAIGAVIGFAVLFYIINYYSKDLPNHHQLAEYNPPTITRLYAADGKLVTEYAKEHRLFVPITAIPKRLIYAFLAAEDKNFYDHPGIDFTGLLRAALTNLMNYGSNKGLVGGSTITQQVVKNFLLTNEKSLTRKIKEAILAFRINKSFSKDRILELYLNQIYLGARSYGVAAAALNYFNKSIDELTIEEAALLAALPQAPSYLNPRRNYDAALARRDWVLRRMYDEDFISKAELKLAIEVPIILRSRSKAERAKAEYFAETVRRELVEIYGEKDVYEGGLVVRTTLDPAYQKYANDALQKGLLAYDQRHGWRGPIASVKLEKNWQEQIKERTLPKTIDRWVVAIVLGTDSEKAEIGLADGSSGMIPLKHMKWARKQLNEGYLGPVVEAPSDVLSPGDIIIVERIKNKNLYLLRQVPEINGAIVALDPHTGRVKAMVGGFDESSQFNRAIQARRQPGSAFKPFVYLKALEKGFTPVSIIVDAPIEMEQGEDKPMWKPQNYSGKFYGPTTLRKGVEHSRNAMTVRLAQIIGLRSIVEVAKRFGINKNPIYNFSLALGAAETGLLDLTNAYAMLVNGGKKIQPSLIERVQDRHGRTIYKRDTRECNDCLISDTPLMSGNVLQQPPQVVDDREQVVDPKIAFQVVSFLEGVVKRGTGKKARALQTTLGGKTGTTNESRDAWFIGFAPDLVVGVYVGFDTPKTLGKRETGAKAALPVFIDFMKRALAGESSIPFRIPRGVKLVPIDAKTGLLPAPNTPKRDVILEAFIPGTEPTATSSRVKDSLPSIGTGGIY